MLKQNHRLVAFGQMIIDLGLTMLALLASYYIRFYSISFTQIIPIEHGTPPISDFIDIKFTLSIFIIWPLIFHINRMYRTKRGLPLLDLVLSVVSSVTLSTIVFLVITFFLKPVREGMVVTPSRAMIITFWVLDTLLILSFRLVTRAISRSLRKMGFNQRHVLIVGAGGLGQLLLRKATENPELGLKIIGFVDDDPEKQWTSIGGASVLGTVDDAPDLIRKYGIEQVYTALPLSAHRRIYHLLSQIQNECVDIKIIPDILEYITLRAGFQNMDGIPVINLTDTPLTGYNLLIKRLMDIFLASLLILLFTPLMLLITILIKLTSPGPVLYRQKRMGMDLKPFMILKFRSMHVTEEGQNGTGWTVVGDPRITLVGKFIRRLNLDEFPQLFNVLRGDMSLVGPRPEQPAFVEEFRTRYPRYMLRHKVKSGITGWAQVNGYRGDTSIKKRLEYDMYYIENWSLALDIKILLLTLFGSYRNFIRPESPMIF